MKKLLCRKYFPLTFYLLISIILLWPVISNSGLPFKYDWNWPLFDLRWFVGHLFDFSNISIVNVFSKYTDLFFTVLGLIIHNPSLGLKIYLLLITATAAYGFHLLIKDKVSSKVVALLVPVFYAFTPYLFIRIIIGFQNSLAAYAVLPLFYYFYNKKEGVRSKELFWAALALAFVFSQSQAGALVSLTLLVGLIISIFYKSFLVEIKKILMLTGWFLLINLPWLIILFTHKSNLSVSSGGDVTTLSSIANLPHSLHNVLMLSDHYITSEFFYALAREKLMILGFGLIFVVALISILNKKLRRFVLTFGLSALIIMPFTVGPTGRFSGIFSWTFNHFPVLALFRETYHFEFLLAFVLVLLFALGADFIVSKIKNHQVAAGLILSGLGLFIIAPFLTFNFAGYLNLQKVPSDYRDFSNYLKSSASCHKIYYPPNLGFVNFKNDKSRDAANSDLLAEFTGVPYIPEGASVLNLGNDEMFERNLLTSLYLDHNDNGQFVTEFQKSGADCLVVRTDLDTKYDQVSNLWREPEKAIRAKWFQSNMLTLARSKQGLSEVKSFGDRIHIFKINPNTKAQSSNKIQNLNDQTGHSVEEQFDLPKIQLPLVSSAKEFDYYKDGWSRGRYAFWRKELFAALKQDFIYTDKQDSVLLVNVDQEGSSELWVRFLDGGSSGKFKVESSKFKVEVQKDAGPEKFVWKNLGKIDLDKGGLKITNILGENAIADLVVDLQIGKAQ